MTVVSDSSPGAAQTAQADWIVVRRVQHTAGLANAMGSTGLRAGELSAVVLAEESDRAARRRDERSELSLLDIALP